MIYLRCQCPLCFRGHCNLAKHVTLLLNGPNVPNVGPVSIYDTLVSNCKCTTFLGPIRLTFLVSVAHRDIPRKSTVHKSMVFHAFVSGAESVSVWEMEQIYSNSVYVCSIVIYGSVAGSAGVPSGDFFLRYPNGYRPQSHETRSVCFGFGSRAPFVFWFLFGFGKTTLVCFGFGFGSGCIFQKLIKIAKITECEPVFGPKVL